MLQLQNIHGCSFGRRSFKLLIIIEYIRNEPFSRDWVHRCVMRDLLPAMHAALHPVIIR